MTLPRPADVRVRPSARNPCGKGKVIASKDRGPQQKWQGKWRLGQPAAGEQLRYLWSCVWPYMHRDALSQRCPAGAAQEAQPESPVVHCTPPKQPVRQTSVVIVYRYKSRL